MRSELSASSVVTVDSYIAAYPQIIQERLVLLRETIRNVAPNALEKMSYGMPTFQGKGNLVHYAACNKHLGFYPTSSAIVAFRDQLSAYTTTKGAVQFPYDQPLPLQLVVDIVKFRLQEDTEKRNSSSQATKVTATRDRRSRHEMPEFVNQALLSSGMAAAYSLRPAYQRNDYLGWIGAAKRPETRNKRLNQMLEELKRGDVYMKMPWRRRQAD